MMVFGHSGGGGFLAGKQVVPVDYEADVSQRLIIQAASCCYSTSDLKSVLDCIDDPFVDINFVGPVSLKIRKAEVLCCDETENVVRVEYQEFKMEVTALFVAVHTGNVVLVRKLLGIGADVNQKHFRGFPTTAAVREGHLEILEILLKAGASQLACEEALLEASCHGRGERFIELLMESDLIRPHIAVHALVTACCRGFTDVVDALLKCGVDVNSSARVLLQSSKPSLHTNIDCTGLVAAVVSRQVSVVRLLLQAGARINIEVQLGAWSWDISSGEEFKVGAALADSYPITWCAVEYYEASGTILQMLLQHTSSSCSSLNATHHGRTLLHHAILCGNTRAVKTLLNCGACFEFSIKTTQKIEFQPIHMAARLGISSTLQLLIDSGCDLNSRTNTADTSLMICAKYKREECLRVLATAGADFSLINAVDQTVLSIAESNRWFLSFQQAVLDVVRAGKVPKSSNISIFSPILFVARSGDVQALKTLISHKEVNINEQDDKGFSAVMITAMNGFVEAFRLLVYAGADVKLANKSGATAISLSKLNANFDMFEKVMLEFTLEKGNRTAEGFYALHYAARHGDLDAVKLLTSRGYDVNVPDGDGYTPLLLAAREDHAEMCKLLISQGSHCDFKNLKGETALSLARKNGGVENDAVCVIMDELARKVVLSGSSIWKHTKGGKGTPHKKVVKMVEGEGVLRWGNSRRRNVICRDAEVGPSSNFLRCRTSKGDADGPGVFRVVTVKNKEVHFVCEGGFEMAELWVWGIKLMTREALAGKMQR